MSENRILKDSLDGITTSLRSFIELSVNEDDRSWAEWISSVANEVRVRCWQRNDCLNEDCPAHRHECGRCWLIDGTLCRTTHQVSPVSCADCDIYHENIRQDPILEVQEQIITLVHNLRLKQLELKDMATRDSLTGLKNRHFFDLYIPIEVEKLRRNRERMSVIMIDINDFKFINDEFGHVYGDHILRECAEILQSSIRSADILFRFGGDEFLIVMTRAGDSETAILIQRIYENLAAWNLKRAGEQMGISFSIGYSLLGAGRELLDVLQEADAMMYEDKRLWKQKKADSADEQFLH